MGVDVGKPLRKHAPVLLKARREGKSESDTVQLVLKLFEDVLGYDPLSELSREKLEQGRFVDIAVQLGGDVPLLVEVVSAGTPLAVEHIDQARRAAARDNVPFILLTNGVVWNLYHVDLDEDLGIALAFTLSLEHEEGAEAAELLGVLHRSSVAKGGLASFWEQRRRLGPATLGRALLSAEVLEPLRGQLKDAGIRVDLDVLAASVHELLRPEVQQRIGAVAVRRSARAAKARGSRSKPAGGRRSGKASHVVEPPKRRSAPHVVEPPDED